MLLRLGRRRALASRRHHSTDAAALDVFLHDVQHSLADTTTTTTPANSAPPIRRSPAATQGSCRLPTVELPRELVARMTALTHQVPHKSQLRTAALALYSRFRDIDADTTTTTTPSPAVGIPINDPPTGTRYAHVSSIAYAVAVMPSTFTATLSVLHHIKRRWPSLHPNTEHPTRIIDLGSGTASVGWAAKEVWSGAGHAIQEYVGVERNASMAWVSEQLLHGSTTSYTRMSETEDTDTLLSTRLLTSTNASPTSLFPKTTIHRTSFVNPSYTFVPSSSKDSDETIAVLSFTLSDLASERDRSKAILSLWNTGAQTLVIIDRGTRAGFSYVADARHQLLQLGRHSSAESSQSTSGASWVLAPCSHDGTCPLHQSPKHFCHFSQRLQRPSPMKQTKHTKLPDEDSKFSYVVIRRGERPQFRKGHDVSSFESLEQWPRIVLPPSKSKGHVTLTVCSSSSQIEKWIVPKSFGRQAYYDARKSHWGDTWPHEAKTKLVAKPSRQQQPLTSLDEDDQKVIDNSKKQKQDQLVERILVGKVRGGQSRRTVKAALQHQAKNNDVWNSF